MNADLLYSDTEESLRTSVRSLLAARLTTTDVATAYDQSVDFHALWEALATQLGLAGLLIPESLGGAGASAREAAVVLEELGGAVAPVPFLTSAVIATSTLVSAGDEELLGQLAGGDATAVLAVPLTSTPGGWTSVTSVGATVTGQVTSVADGHWADWFIVPTSTESDEPALIAVPAGGATIAPVVSLDMSRPLSDLTFEGVEGRILCSGEAARSAVAEALQLGAGLLVSEQYGVARWCVETTVAYAKERYQFGRAIGSYQAVKHRLADLFLQVESLRAIARLAADSLAQRSDDTAVVVALGQAYASDTAVHAAEEAVQLHGGIGMTWEHPAHLYLKLAKADQLAFGTSDHHRLVLADLVDLPA